MQFLEKHRHIKLVTTETRRKYLVSEPNYHKVFHRKFISNRNEKSRDFLLQIMN